MDGSEEQEREVDYVLDPAFWEKGQALGFPIRFELVLKHLRQDMRDDWYFDCLQYDDLFKNPDEAKRIIMSLLQEGKRGRGLRRGGRHASVVGPARGRGIDGRPAAAERLEELHRARERVDPGVRGLAACGSPCRLRVEQP